MKRSLIAAIALTVAAGCSADADPNTEPAATTTTPSAVKTVKHDPDFQAKFECEILITRELDGSNPEFEDAPVRHSSPRISSWDSRVLDGNGQWWRFGCFHYPQSGKVALLYLDRDN